MSKALNKRIRAFKVAFNGIGLFIREGVHSKIMILVSLFTLLLAWLVNLSQYEWITIILCCGLVLAFEALNSALEYAVNLATSEYHDLARKAKDTAAGAVLLMSITSVIIGVVIFAPKILRYFSL